MLLVEEPAESFAFLLAACQGSQRVLVQLASKQTQETRKAKNLSPISDNITFTTQQEEDRAELGGRGGH